MPKTVTVKAPAASAPAAAPTAPSPRPSPPKVLVPPPPAASLDDQIAKALHRLLAAAPGDIVGVSGLTPEGLAEYKKAREHAQALLEWRAL